MDQYVLAIWPIGPMMATRPERVILESSGVNFWQARYSPDGQWVSFVAQRMRNPGTVEIGIVAERQQSRHDVDADTWKITSGQTSRGGHRMGGRCTSSHGELTATSTCGACPSTQRAARRAGSRFKSRISARPIGASIPIWVMPRSALPAADSCFPCRT